MQQRNRGFSLIEQLAAIAVVGTASATAMPALVALNEEAQARVLPGLAAAAGSAMVLNQAGCLVTGQRAVPGKCQPVRDCADVAGLLMQDLPEGYRVLPSALPAKTVGTVGTCELQRLGDGARQAFPGLAAGG